jgi:hypothetical protein
VTGERWCFAIAVFDGDCKARDEQSEVVVFPIGSGVADWKLVASAAQGRRFVAGSGLPATKLSTNGMYPTLPAALSLSEGRRSWVEPERILV